MFRFNLLFTVVLFIESLTSGWVEVETVVDEDPRILKNRRLLASLLAVAFSERRLWPFLFGSAVNGVFELLDNLIIDGRYSKSIKLTSGIDLRSCRVRILFVPENDK